MDDGYLTIAQRASFEFSEKHSRFIGCCAAVADEGEALEFITCVKESHRTASHNVWAYLLREQNLCRYTDDGEPKGTAGLPVLDVLKGFGAVDAAVVVTRYFGGTLLGTGGLVRAYSQAARMALTNAGVAEMALCARLSLECSYSDYDRVVRLLESVGASVKSEFLDSVEMTLLVRERDVQTVTGKLCEFTGGRIIPRLIEKHFEKVGGQKRI